MMSAYTVAQILKFKENHEVDLIIVDNNSGDGSIEYLDPFVKEITIVNYPKDKLQSHGIGIDYVLPHIKTDYFLTLESDSYPVKPFLDYYEQVINGGFDMAASLLTLSGGSYGHPAGSLYKKSIWHECKKYCDEMPYKFFPNMLLREGFKMHTMIHVDYLDKVLENPEEWFELTDDYKPYSKEMALKKMEHYSPVCGPFHDGRGGRQESVKTFGGRTWESEAPFALYNSRWQKIIGRVGEEPGQALYYWSVAMKKKIFQIPIEIKWLEGKENRQQEYTLNEAGIKHAWGVSAYHGYTPEGDEYVAKIKQELPEKLYNTLPPNQRIK